MNAPLLVRQPSAIAELTAKQLTTVKATIAKDCDPTEFDLFINICQRTGLDPFRRQVFPVVFNKKNSDRRRMVIVIGQDGQRVIAQRCGNYRPASEPTHYEFDPEFKSAVNPLGIVFARVTLWQQDNTNAWWPVIGEAFWDEFAPISDEWVDGQDGKRKKSGRKTLDDSGNWAKMPRIMIQKCATMQALRAGWPDQFGGLYDEAEMDRQRASERDMTASEIVDAEFEEARLKKIGGKDALLVQFEPADPLDRVLLGQFADRVLSWVRDCDGPASLAEFRDRNAAAFREYWAKAPGEALDLKRALEGADRQMREVAQ